MKHGKCLKILAAICFCALLIIPVNANSAMTFWYGTSGSSVISSDENCPLTVLHENLRFDLGTQPLPSQSINPSTGEYENTFTAEYTFHNPSDMQVTALLSFPLGKDPSYAAAGHGENPQLYRITCGNEETDTRIRYTWMSGSAFSLDQQLGRLEDTYTEGVFFHTDLPVTIYTFRFSYDESQLDEYTYADVMISFENDHENRKLMFLPEAHYYRSEDGIAEAGLYAGDGAEVSVCVFGKDFAQFPDWRFLSGYGENAEEIEGMAELSDKESLTYQEFVLRQEKEYEDITDVDFYNAVTAMLEQMSSGSSLIETMKLDDQLLKWLQYELNFEPQETLVNTVSAPAFPSIDTGYDETVYEYSYLLSPASSWKEFGTLDVSVNTDQYLTSSSTGGFEKTAKGYQAHFDSLPESELTFRICATENPKKPFNWSGFAVVIFVLIPAAAIILFLVLLVKIVTWLIRQRNQKDDI